MRYQGKIVHVVCTRRASAPDAVRWYVRYVWLNQERVARDTVLASGETSWRVGSARECAIACLRAALAELEKPETPDLAAE